MSREIPTTNKFVDVPMVVDIPPRSVAIPMGIRIFDELTLALCATAIRAGIKMTTIGVLLMKALKNAPKNSTPRNEIFGCLVHDVDKKPISGCNEPLISIALPIANNAQMVTNASWPKLDTKK